MIGHGLMTVICRFELGRRKIERNERTKGELKMCAKKIINERKITKALNGRYIRIIGCLQWENGEYYAFLSDCCFALLVNMDQIKKEGRLWKMIERAVVNVGYDKIFWEDTLKRESRSEDIDSCLKVFEYEEYLISDGKYTGETRNKDGREIDIVQLGNREMGYDSAYVDIIKDKRALKEGTFLERDLSPVYFKAQDSKTLDLIADLVIMPFILR